MNLYLFFTGITIFLGTTIFTLKKVLMLDRRLKTYDVYYKESNVIYKIYNAYSYFLGKQINDFLPVSHPGFKANKMYIAAPSCLLCHQYTKEIMEKDDENYLCFVLNRGQAAVDEFKRVHNHPKLKIIEVDPEKVNDMGIRSYPVFFEFDDKYKIKNISKMVI